MELIIKSLFAICLTGALGCASAPAPDPDPVPDKHPVVKEAEEPPERGQLIAADDSETAEGERLERAAQDYQAALESMFDKLSEELNACYLPQLKRNPTLAGSIVVDFTVFKGGAIGEGPSVGPNSLNNEAVETCVLDLIRAQTYPEPYNNQYAKVSRTFRFGAF